LKINKFEIQGFFFYYVNDTVEIGLVRIFFFDVGTKEFGNLIFISYQRGELTQAPATTTRRRYR
jgi:hypothetical protein